MQVKMVNNKIAVEKLKRAAKTTASFLHEPNVSDNQGVIKFAPIGSEYVVGMRVYYGNNREEIRMNGIDVYIMDADNIVAIVEDTSEQIP